MSHNLLDNLLEELHMSHNLLGKYSLYRNAGRRLAWKTCIELQKAELSAVCAWNLSVRQEISGSTLTTLTSEMNRFFSRRLRRICMRMEMTQAKSLLWLILSKCEGCRGRKKSPRRDWVIILNYLSLVVETLYEATNLFLNCFNSILSSCLQENTNSLTSF